MRSPALRQRTLLALASALALAGCGKDAKKAAAPAAPAFTTDEQKVSYAIGFNMGKGASQQKGFVIDQAALKAGIDDGFTKDKMSLPEADIEKSFQTLQQRVQAAAAAEAQKNTAAGAAFLEKNKSRPGVKTTASGLQYEVLKSGKGPKAKATNTVVVAYHGTLIDGTVFDSSVERGDTAEFPVTGVIPGWTEALQLMSVGDKWKLYLPANLAYGPRAAGKIPPGSALIFEVELKQIK
jgi:FKBP-type peptidyl-prolyl cis-trans isomerase